MAADDPAEDPASHVSSQEAAHPFENKYSSFKPKEWQLEHQIPLPSPSMEDNTFILVDELSSLKDMVNELKKVKEIAIALQHTFQVTFHPTCCLMEISTRTQGYIIDPLALKDELKLLNEVFTDEGIVKVMNRNQSDLMILQDRHGLFVINLFDTFSAAKFGRHKKAKNTFYSMLQRYCGIEASGIEGEVDWMLRPVPEKLLKFARMKVHYLLHIYDCQRNTLVEKGFINQHYDQCTEFCRSAFFAERDRHRHDSYLGVYMRIRGKDPMSPQQLECFRLLYEWSHKAAKENDKSMNFTLHPTDMFRLAKEVPREVEKIAKCFTDEVLPPLVAANIEDVLQVILLAVDNVSESAVYKEDEMWKSLPKMDRQDEPQTENSYLFLYDLYKRFHGALNPQQLECFRLLYYWSCKTAKEHRKSQKFTLHFKDMGSIAKELPLNIEEIVHCCADEVLPPLVEEHLQEVHDIIHQAIKNVTDTTTPKKLTKKERRTQYAHTEDSYLRVYEMSKKMDGPLSPQQLECFRLLYNWSHEIAIAKDKTQASILSLKDLAKIAKVLPKEIEGIAKCCNNEVMPPFVKEHAKDIQKLILQAVKTVTDTTVPEIFKKWRPPRKRRAKDQPVDNQEGSQEQKTVL